MEERITRRRFMSRAAQISAGLSLAAVFPALLEACSDDEEESGASIGSPTPRSATPGEAQGQASVLVGDVVEFRLVNDQGWKWGGGWVTMRLHEAFFNGEKVHYVRTDASDEGFASAEKLVFVPKLQGALDGGRHGEIFLFDDALPEQLPVVSTAPGAPDFTPLLRVIRARWTGQPEILDSADRVCQEASSDSGDRDDGGGR